MGLRLWAIRREESIGLNYYKKLSVIDIKRYSGELTDSSPSRQAHLPVRLDDPDGEKHVHKEQDLRDCGDLARSGLPGFRV